MNKISFLRPSVARRETYLHYLAKIDESRCYSNFGPLNSLFEQRLMAEHFSSLGALTTVANATIGLMLAIASTRRSSGKYALMPSFTFPATPLAAIWCGLVPYFIDIDPDDWSMSSDALLAALEELGEEVAVVVPYATFGTAIDTGFYAKLVDEGFPVVIDAAASLGTRYDEIQFGTGFSGVVVFSLHATKPFGIGEGGLCYSRNPDLIAKIRRSSNFGFSETKETGILGLNGKLSEYGAAVGLAMLDEFATHKRARHDVYQLYLTWFYRSGLLEQGWQVYQPRGDAAFQFLSVLHPESGSRNGYIERLTGNGIESRSYFSPPCHKQDFFASCPHSPLPSTENIASRVISLPLWEEMTNAEIDAVVQSLTTAGY